MWYCLLKFHWLKYYMHFGKILIQLNVTNLSLMALNFTFTGKYPNNWRNTGRKVVIILPHNQIVQPISATDVAVRFLHCCLSAAMLFSVVRCLPLLMFSQTLLHRLIIELFNTVHPSFIFFIFSRLASTDVHF